MSPSQVEPLPASELEALRKITERLEGVDGRTARYLACYACVLARVADADLVVVPSETAEMRRRVAALAGIGEDEAGVLVDIAQSQSRNQTAPEKRAVTEEFRRLASDRQRTDVFFCLYAVAAADGSVSPEETAEISAIADELGVDRKLASGLKLEDCERLFGG